MLRDLGSQVREQRLQQHGVELLWYKVVDMLDPAQEKDTRHTVFDFLILLVLGQYDTLEMMRPVLFKFIKTNRVPEDLDKVVGLLIALTENGKDIVHIEEQMGPLLLEMLDTEEDAIVKALAEDLNKPPFEAVLMEMDVVRSYAVKKEF